MQMQNESLFNQENFFKMQESIKQNEPDNVRPLHNTEVMTTSTKLGITD